jgi:hypothetical protein
MDVLYGQLVKTIKKIESPVTLTINNINKDSVVILLDYISVYIPDDFFMLSPIIEFLVNISTVSC